MSQASAIVVIAGSAERTGRKYGNRAPLYVILEAGHAVQNILLCSERLGTAALITGGATERRIRSAFHLDDSVQPLSMVAIGGRGEPLPADACVDVEWAALDTMTYSPPFFMAFAKLRGQQHPNWACGRSVMPSLARTKAISEAREWAACENQALRSVSGRIVDVPNPIAPDTIVRYTDQQYSHSAFPFERFSPTESYVWVEGRVLGTDLSVHVLADHVYYPYASEGRRHTYASSSGVAAHPSRGDAVELAILELLERDAFMIAYLSGGPSPLVDPASVPDDLQARLDRLSAEGFRVVLRDISVGLAPVALVFAQSTDLEYTTCAASCKFSFLAAIDHALMEVESSIFCRVLDGRPPAISPKEVVGPRDHGRLYQMPEFYRYADHLGEATSVVGLKSCGMGCPTSLSDTLLALSDLGTAPLLFDMKVDARLGGNQGLHIVRAIIPGVVPISFGLGLEPLGIPRLRPGGGCPHAARVVDGIVFPHPYN